MALSLDGTTGITSDGGTPVIENLDTTATGIAVTGVLTTTGNVGVGTSSPAAKLSIYGATENQIRVTDDAAYYYAIGRSSTQGFLTFYGSQAAATGYIFTGAAGERMRIDSSGSVRINNTANATFAAQLNTQFTTAQNCGLYLKVTNTSGAQGMIIFGNTTNDAVGSISTTGSSTAYLTSSDYRLKTDAQPMTGASGRVLALNPVNFKWISSGERVDGFLAHEAAEVVPEAVSGEKDAMRDEEYEVTPAVEATYDEEGNELTPAVEAVMGTRTVPDYQGIDQSKLVPLLTAALQEALAKIDDLTARVSALEANNV